MKDSKFALVLGSGGARGIAHIGFLKALDENEIVPDLITGCSMGSVVGGLYAKGMTPDEMKDFALKLKNSDIVDFNLTLLTDKHFLKSVKMQKLLDKLFGETTFEELKIPFCCNAFDINKGEMFYFLKGKVADGVRASSSIPLFFKPMEYKDRLLVDGGTTMRLPIEIAYKMGATKVVAVDVLGNLRSNYSSKNILEHGLHVIDAVDAYFTKHDPNYNKVDLLLFPDLKDMSQYSVKNLEFAYQMGYECAMRNMEDIKKLAKE